MEDSIPADRVLLDTHVFIWLMNGMSELEHAPARREIEEASESGALLLCSISLFETAVFTRQGRVRPSLPLRDWFSSGVETPGLRLVPLDADLAVEAAALPGEFPGDGADRLIVAAARLAHARLVSADRRLQEYAAAGHVRFLAV
ncbi:MAG: type II toxin-antitoxin system VapC family toxin [Spirochaetaceae bacterium]